MTSHPQILTLPNLIFMFKPNTSVHAKQPVQMHTCLPLFCACSGDPHWCHEEGQARVPLVPEQHTRYTARLVHSHDTAVLENPAVMY